MRPIDIEVLMHYYTRADDFRNGAPETHATIANLVRLELLENNKRECGVPGPLYVLTERGTAYCDTLQAVSLPVKQWIIPEGSLRITVNGDCGKPHPSFESWQACHLCNSIGESRAGNRA